MKIFKEAQKAVIGTRDERITEYLLDDVFDQICELTGDGIRVKREGRPQSSIVSYEDLFITGSENQAIQPPSGETILSGENRPARKYSQATKANIRLGDLDCPQHFEFIDKLEALSHEDNLLSRVNDIFLIREASRQALPATAFREAGVLFDGFEV
ncbi:MAG TPA: hypothetical protein EYN14_00370 [Alphaproteobacteria bacterium]|nr:hypothetical protein [Alphaproteobacteria bacterium]